MILLPALFAVAAAAVIARILACSDAPLLPRDVPNERSLHTRTTPRSGGLAVLLGVSAGLAVAGMLPSGRSWWVAGAVLLVAATSFADDRRGLPPGIRLASHSVAAAGVVWGAGLSASGAWIPGAGHVSFGPLSGFVSFLALLWITNLYNFMDGMDGFAGTMTLVGGAFLGFALLSHGAEAPARVAFVLAGAAAGFLTQNLPPARLFLGDVGAVTIGFLVGVLGLAGQQAAGLDPAVVPVVFAPFVVDATVTLGRRALRGERWWQPHRSHSYQRLVLAGWDHRRTLVFEVALMLVSGAAGLAWADGTPAVRAAALVAIAALGLAVHILVRALEGRAAPPTPR